MTLQKGDNAPAFTLKDSDGNDINSQDLLSDKKLLILFFPLAFTGVCTKELCTIRDDYSVYEKLNANVIAISVDSFFTLKEFKAKNNINYSLLSDFNKETAKAYGALYDEFFGMAGVAKRSAFVVNQDGKIEYAEVLEEAGNLPDFEAIKEVLK